MYKQEIHKFVKDNQEANLSTTKLIQAYYVSKGITETTTVKEWLLGVTSNKYPAYTILRKHIKSFHKE